MSAHEDEGFLNSSNAFRVKDCNEERNENYQALMQNASFIEILALDFIGDQCGKEFTLFSYILGLDYNGMCDFVFTVNRFLRIREKQGVVDC